MRSPRLLGLAVLVPMVLVAAVACTAPVGGGGTTTTTTTTTTTIVPNDAPVAVAGSSVSTGVAPLPVSFFSTGSTDPDGIIVSYAWNFADGSTSSATNPGHTFTLPGTYNVTLTVTDDLGGTGTDTVTVVVTAPVNQEPTAVANAAPSIGRFPLEVTLLSAGSIDNDGSIVGYNWNFGDGTGFSTDPNPTHIYAIAGFYTATLTVTDDDGAIGSATVGITVNPNTPPTAVANASVTSGLVNLSVNFTSTGSNDADGSIVSYLWDFGDGGTSTAPNPSHTFTTPGVRTVTLTVTDNDGATAMAARTITVTALNPTASFTKSLATSVAPQTVTFNAAASSDANPGGSIVSYAWSFGDGGTATGVAPSHVYTTTGTRTVTLTVTNALGLQASTTQTITINTFLPPQNFTMYDAEGENFDDGRFYFRWNVPQTAPGTTLTYEINVKANAGCIAFGDKTRTVASSGAQGAQQEYTWVQGWPFSNVCLGSTYDYRARSVRAGGPDGTQYSAWTAWQTRSVNRT